MESIIKKVTQKNNVVIKEKAYTPIAKAKYVTESNPKNWYIKIFFPEHRVLVMSPNDNIIYFGQNVGSIGISPPFGPAIDYLGKRYNLVAEDYQIVKNLEFGSPIDTEGEVKFWDFEGDNNKNQLLSLGIVQRTGKRADIVAEIISIEDINLVSIA